MTYLPVEFNLHDFQLNLNTMQSASFHKRLKELGFDSMQDGDTIVYGRGKSRITVFVRNGAELAFLPDFFDDTPGGTVYAILEKMCVAFGGTMVGQYSVPSLGKTWDVRISQGMNLSGRADVGQREHVMEDTNHTPSSSPQPGKSQQKATQTVSQQPAQASAGEVQDGPAGESTRDKLYRVFVEEQYQKYVQENGENPNQLFAYIKAFNEQFQKEEETRQETKRAEIIRALYKFTSLDSATHSEKELAKEVDLLVNNEEEITSNLIIDTSINITEEDIDAVIYELVDSL